MRWSPRATYLMLGVVVVVAGSVAFDVGSSSSTSDRASDLRGLVRQVKTDLGSCNSSLTNSFSAYEEVVGGRRDEQGAADKIIRGNEADCTPVANSDLYDLATLEIPGTLRSFDLQPALTALQTWAYPDASTVMADLDGLLNDPSDAAARSDLTARMQTMGSLDRSAEGSFAAVAARLRTAVTSLDLRSADPVGSGGL